MLFQQLQVGLLNLYWMIFILHFNYRHFRESLWPKPSVKRVNIMRLAFDKKRGVQLIGLMASKDRRHRKQTFWILLSNSDPSRVQEDNKCLSTQKLKKELIWKRKFKEKSSLLSRNNKIEKKNLSLQGNFVSNFITLSPFKLFSLKNHKYQIKLFTQYFQINYPNHITLMALRGQKTGSSTNEEGLSKRQQRKLELTLKQFADLDPKPKKRRKLDESGKNSCPSISSDEKRQDPNSQYHPKQQTPDNIPETKQHSMINITPNREINHENGQCLTDAKINGSAFLNKGYFKQEEEVDLLDFMNQYQYRQLEKKIEKGMDWVSKVDEIGIEIPQIKNDSSLKLIEKARNIINIFNKAIDKKPFRKNHSQFKKLFEEIQK